MLVLDDAVELPVGDVCIKALVQREIVVRDPVFEHRVLLLEDADVDLALRNLAIGWNLFFPRWDYAPMDRVADVVLLAPI